MGRLSSVDFVVNVLSSSVDADSCMMYQSRIRCRSISVGAWENWKGGESRELYDCDQQLCEPRGKFLVLCGLQTPGLGLELKAALWLEL